MMKIVNREGDSWIASAGRSRDDGDGADLDHGDGQRREDPLSLLFPHQLRHPVHDQRHHLNLAVHMAFYQCLR